eukprot:gene13342-biopygen12957
MPLDFSETSSWIVAGWRGGGPPGATRPTRPASPAGCAGPAVPGRARPRLPGPFCHRGGPCPGPGQAPATVGNPWETPWKRLGETLENIAKTLESLGAPELRESQKPWKTLENLGIPWNGLGERSARGQGAARPMPRKKERKANAKVGWTMGKPWNALGETLGSAGKPWKPLEDLGKTTEDLGEPLGKPSEDPW